MLSSKSFLALDFGAGSLKLAEFEVGEQDALTLRQYGVKALGIEGSQDSKREAVLLKAIQELLAEKGIRARSTNVCAPGFHVFSKFVKLPPVDTSKVTQIIQYEAQQNVPFPLEEVVWDYQILGSTPTGEMEVLLVAIKSDIVEGLFRTADSAGLRLQLVDVSPAALCNAFRFNYGDLEGCTMLLDIGAKTSNLLFFEKGKVYSRSINIGANSITQDFVAEAKIPFAKAEQLKIAEGFVSLGGAYEEPDNPHQAAISKIARQVLTRLHIQVNQTIQFYRGQQGGSAPQRLFLAGGGSIMTYTEQFFAEKLNVPVEYFNPFRSVQIDPAVNVEELAKVAHAFGEVVGLGLRNLAQCPVELNLVPKSIRKRQQFDQKKPYFVATVFSLILVVFAYGLFYGRLTAIKQNALEKLTSEFAPQEAKYNELQKHLDAIAKEKKEADQLAGYIKDRFFWGDLLGEIRRILLQTEQKNVKPGQEVGVWIEAFGNVTEGGLDMMMAGQEGGINPAMRMDPALAARYGLVPSRSEGGERVMAPTGSDAPSPPPAPAPGSPAPFGARGRPSNVVDIVQVKLRSVNLNRNGVRSANGDLVFSVEKEFQSSTNFFAPDGTKLSGELENVDESALTFGFSMNLKLRNPIKL